ncbi:MAG: hypothetical protein HOF55_07220 [Candidatus Marinimicrobia bacterium]|nr:hypothetical protein [Candidatus Neomarinimicrobiota bacterium]MBT3829559.1 hypothetical protein [Candidatus Neomarinimicrobiota bacterium]MBT7871596.1 hypothetical protein [Candidatus Neomarinimicrobiota bacterium]
MDEPMKKMKLQFNESLIIRKRIIPTLIIFIGIFFTAISGKNLSLLSEDGINNVELLDVYIYEDYAFIPGGLGGLNIVDISDRSNPQVVGEYTANNCDWGRLYSWSVFGNYTFGAGRDCGIHVLDISQISNPQLVENFERESESMPVRYEHTSTHSIGTVNYLFAAGHQAGVDVFTINSDEQSSTVLNYISTIASSNAWATQPFGNILFIADGATGIRSVDISNPSNPIPVNMISASGSVKDLTISENRLFAAVGASGVDMFNISNPATPLFLSNYNTSGYASRVAANDSLVAVSDWDDVEILGFTEGELILKGIKNTGGRSMAIDMVGNDIFSAEWIEFQTMRYGNVEGPDLDISNRKIEFPRVPFGENETISVQLTNSGRATLNITGISSDNVDISIPFNSAEILPNASLTLPITYTPNIGNSWTGYITISSNDSDENNEKIRIIGNHPSGPMVGDPAPNFNLPIVNGVGMMELSDLGENPAVIAFFSAW